MNFRISYFFVLFLGNGSPYTLRDALTPFLDGHTPPFDGHTLPPSVIPRIPLPEARTPPQLPPTLETRVNQKNLQFTATELQFL